jgi:transcriptional regulator with XRE-family HTH domain
MNEIGISQKMLADEIGMTDVTISRWMNGTRHPTIENVEKMADVLGVTIDISTETKAFKCPIIDIIEKYQTYVLK